MNPISPETLQELRELKTAGDPSLSKEEKETTITVDNDRDMFKIHADIPVHIRWILSLPHSDTEITSYRVINEQLVGITAFVPKGYLKLQGTNRKSQTNGAITTISD